jgi:hypothetical protein
MSGPKPTLWIDPLAPRFFVADQAPPEGGGVWLVSLDGAARKARIKGWAHTVINETEARARHQAAVLAATQTASKAMAQARAEWAHQQPGLADVVRRLADTERPATGTEILALWLGRSAEVLLADPAQAQADVEAALAQLSPTPAPVLAPASPSAAQVTVPEAVWGALVTILDRWWWSELTLPSLGAHTTADVEALAARLMAELADDPLRAEARARRMGVLRAEARAAIDRDTAGWRVPTPSFDELLRGGST